MSHESDDETVYGAGLPLFDALRLLAQYAPLIGRLQVIAAAPTAHARAVAVVETLRWAASRTEGTVVDDEAAEHLAAVLSSDEGKAFFEWMVKVVQEFQA